jgi:hypothetical protein
MELKLHRNKALAEYQRRCNLTLDEVDHDAFCVYYAVLIAQFLKNVDTKLYEI